jgi:serine/threonine-protein kinase
VRTRVPPLPGEDARAFGRRLDVEMVVEGTVRRAGDDVRITVRLSSVVDGFQVWAARYKGSLGDLLDLIDRAAREIGGAIDGTKLAELPRPAIATDDVERYLRARHAALGSSVATMELAHLQMAREIARDDPRLLSVVASGYARLSGIHGEALLDEARTLVRRAIDVAPALGEPWLALAYVRLHGRDTVGAAEPVQRAIRNAPSLADAHDFAGRLLCEAGLEAEAIRLLDRAIWLDPTLAFGLQGRARIDALRGDWDRAARNFERLRELRDPNTFGPMFWRLSLWAGRDLVERPDVDGVKGQVRVVVEATRAVLDGEPDVSERLRAVRTWGRELEPRSRMARLLLQIECELLAFRGDADGALDALSRSVDQGLEDLPWITQCPLLVPLAGDPRHVALTTTVRARAEAVAHAWREAAERPAF